MFAKLLKQFSFLMNPVSTFKWWEAPVLRQLHSGSSWFIVDQLLTLCCCRCHNLRTVQAADGAHISQTTSFTDHWRHSTVSTACEDEDQRLRV